MFLSFLSQGPIWVEIGASLIGKAVAAGVLSAASNTKLVKSVYETLSKTDFTEEEKVTSVINIFSEDANK